jgi:indolepyruvate decarboxylase
MSRVDKRNRRRVARARPWKARSLGELDQAMKSARANKSGAYIEIMGGKMDMPPALAFAHGQLKAMYGDTP